MNDDAARAPKTETVEAQKELFAGDKSRLEKYADLVVGRRGLWQLAR